MSRATISTGGIDFPLSEDEPPQPEPTDPSTAMHIAVLADFSGRHSRAGSGQSPAPAQAVEVNKDNFEEVFAGLDVQLHLPVAEQPLRFAELDDLHPDFIYQRVGLFDKMRILKRKLSKADKFAEAAAEITTWANYRGEHGGDVERDQGVPLPDNLLDAVLQQRDLSEQLAAAPGGDIDRLIKDIVSPFIEAKADPRQQDMLAAVDDATSDLMRRIMHHSDFQRLEASWRCLYMLVRRLELDSRLKLFLIDISQAEIRADLDAADAPDQSQLYKLLVEKQQTPGSVPYSLIIGDYRIGDSQADIETAAAMAAIAAAANATWVSGGHEHLAGCRTLNEQPDADDWDYQPDTRASWEQVCGSPQARHLALAAPRFMVRLPYGRQTSAMENFDYEELSARDDHDYYLWGNSAFLIALLLAQSYRQHGWDFRPGRHQEVGDLPLHVHRRDGEEQVKPCAEILLTDRAAGCLQAVGLLPVRSINGRDAVVVAEFCSISAARVPIHGRWSG